MKPTKQELINEILRIAPEHTQEAVLQQKTVQELSQIIRDIGTAFVDEYEQTEDRILQAQAEAAAATAIHRMKLKQQKDAEDAAQLPKDRAVFDQTAREHGQFGANDANFNLARKHCGAGLTPTQLLDAFHSGLMLAPPSQQELQTWHADKIRRYNEWLMTAAPEELRQAAKMENALRAEQEKLTVFERDLAESYRRDMAAGKKPLPSHWRGRELNKAALRQCSKEDLRELIRLYGSAQISAKLHGITRSPDGRGGHIHFHTAEAA